MALINFDAEAMEYLSAAPGDPEAAAEALRLAARYIREGKPLPDPLAGHLADAIDAAMAKPTRARAKEFARELHLTALNARPKGDLFEIGREFEALRRRGLTVESAYARLVESYKVDASQPNLSESTIKRRVREYLEARRSVQE